MSKISVEPDALRQIIKRLQNRLDVLESTTTTSDGGVVGPITLDDLTDVVITAPTIGDVLTWDGANYINLPAGGVTPTTGVSVEMDFGTAGTYTVRTVTGQAWVTSTMVFACMVAGDVKTDHDPEDGLLEGLVFTVSDVVAGDGFNLHAYAPNGTFGKFNVNVSASNGSGSVVTI
jgi:hypothetical protein